MFRRITTFLLVIIASASFSNAIESGVPSLSDKEIVQLNDLETYIERGTSENHLISHLKEKSYPVRAMSTAILYRINQKAYQDALFNEFSVNDYKARGRGEYNFTSKETVTDVLKKIENRYPKIANKRSELLLAFYAFRNSNTWITTDKGKISMARFFRAAFLASVFKGTGLDAAAVTNSIDEKTQKSNQLP